MRLLIKAVRARGTIPTAERLTALSNAESSITAGDRLQKKWRENFKLHFRTRTRHLNLISSERERGNLWMLDSTKSPHFYKWISLKYGFFLAFLLYIQWHPESGVACQPEHRIPPAAVIRKFPASEMNIHSISPAGKCINILYECVAAEGIWVFFSLLLTVTQTQWNERDEIYLFCSVEPRERASEFLPLDARTWQANLDIRTISLE